MIEYKTYFRRTARRFATHFLSHVRDHELDFADLDEELGNLRRALASYRYLQAWPELAGLIQASGVFLDTRGHWEEHRYWLEAVVARHEAIGDLATHIDVVESLAAITSSAGERDRAKELYEIAIHLAEQAKDELRLARAYYGLGTICVGTGKIDLARSSWEKARLLAERAADEALPAVVHYLQGTWRLLNREEEEQINSALGLTARITSRLGLAGRLMLVQFRAMTHLIRGELDEANHSYQEALELARKEGDKQGVALTLYQLGHIAHRAGNLLAALDYYRQSESITRELGDRTGLMTISSATGLLLLQQRRFDLALHYLDESVELERRSGDPRNVAENLYWLGYAVFNTGDPVRAKQIWQESLAIFTQLGSPETRKVVDVLQRLETEATAKQRDSPPLR